MRTTVAPFLVGFALAACGGGGSDVDAQISTIDARTGCEPAAALPSQFRPIAEVSTGLVNVTNSGGVWSGTIDGTAGGLSQAADNPYIYVDLRTGAKVDITDLDAYSSQTWDIALKRASLRSNGGDSGPGMRSVSIVTGATTLDDFADAECQYLQIPGGEPNSAFGEWYDYDDATHIVTPKVEVYVFERGDGTHTALRVIDYYGDASMPMRGAFYQVEWKDL
jgi:hypothetical protein